MDNILSRLVKLPKTNAVLVMDGNGIIKEINDAFTQFFGFMPTDIIGKHSSILFTLEDQLIGLPEKELENVMRDGQSDDNNYVVHKNKRKTWVSGESVLISGPGTDAIILKLIQNIDIQKTHEATLQQLTDFNERILKCIEDLVVVVDEERQIVKSNLAFQQAFGNEADSIEFDSLIKIENANPSFRNLMDHVLGSMTTYIHEEVEVTISNGKKRIYAVHAKRLDGLEQRSTYLLTMHDVTLVRETEKQREDIIGFVAHELRNPLSNIVLCNELLNETLQEGNISSSLEYLSRSHNNVLRLNKMIAELYDATKIEGGNIHLDRERFHVGEVIREAVETMKELQPMYKISVIGETECEVYADRFRIMQVVINYLSNGIKYSNGSSEIELMLSETPDFIVVSVKDRGLGIANESLPYVFDRFFRAEKTKDFEGIGLGLYLCRKIVHAHEGEVWVESEEGKGSVFYFSIPRQL